MSRPRPPHPQPGPEGPASCSRTVTVQEPMGLHLRTGKAIVQTANRFQARIAIRNLDQDVGPVDAKSILQIMQLQARQGHRLELVAQGPDARPALEALAQIFAQPGEPAPPS